MNQALKKQKRISELFEHLSLFFFCLSAVPHIPPEALLGAGAASKALGKLFKKFKDFFRESSVPDLNQLRSELNDILMFLPHKIIIVIDDIDRLNNTEIRQMFQLVRSLADFQNTIYVMAFDKDVVLKALNEVQKAPGQFFLEKIVTVSFDIVSPTRSELKMELHDRIKEIVGERWNEKTCASVSERLLPFCSTVRDVTRFLNAFEFSYALLKDDVWLQDLAIITAVQVHAPAVYSEIPKNKHLLTGEYRPPFLETFSKEDESDYRERIKSQYDRIFERSVKISPDQIGDILKAVFPRIEEAYASSTTESNRESEWRKDRRICSPNFFDRYFKLTIPADEFSQKEIDSILAQADDNVRFSRELERLKNQNRLEEFLYALPFMDISNMPLDQVATAISVLLNLDIDDTSFGGPITLKRWALAAQIAKLVRSFLQGFDSLEGRFQMLARAIGESRASRSIYTIISVVTDEHKVHLENPPGSLRPEWQLELLIVESIRLDELKHLTSSIVLERSEDGRLVKEPRLPETLEEWRGWADESEFGECLDRLTAEDDRFRDFVRSFYRPGKKVYPFKWLEPLLPRIRSIADSEGFEHLDDTMKSAVRAVLDAFPRSPSDRMTSEPVS